jgi:mRNA interferase MazF
MATTIKTDITIQKTLFDQVEILAQQLNVSQSHLFGIAIENFIKNYQGRTLFDEITKAYEDQLDPNEQAKSPCQDAKTATQIDGGRKVISQGDIYWIRLEKPGESKPSYPHPHVVIQEDVFNRSRINTVVVCALTSNMNRANEPGNVLLEVGEANLPKQSVIVVSQISTVDKTRLGECIGSLTKRRINQILAGMRFLPSSFFAR